MGRGKLRDVQNGSRDPTGGLERVEGPYRRSGTGQGTPGEVRDGSGTLGEVWNGSGRSRTGRGTLGKVWDGVGDP